MGVVARFGGAGLTVGSTLVADQFGAGDTPIYVNQDNTPTISNTGLNTPRLKFDQEAAKTGYVAWGPTRLGQTFTNCAVRMYIELAARSSAAHSLINTTTGATANWKIDVAGSAGTPGELRIRDGNNVQYASTGGDGNVLALNTEYRLEVVTTAAGAVTLYVYSGHSTTLLFSKAATGLPSPTFTSLRFGNVSTSPTALTHYMDHLAVSNQAALIGPATGLRVGTFNGTYENPLDAKVWDGSSEVAASFSSVV